jgi:hypothetical protein
MKTIIFVALIMGSAIVATAQAPAKEKGDSATQTPYENKNDLLNRNTDDMVLVPPGDIPKPLLATLKTAPYEGWEKSEMYRSTDSKLYELRVGKGDKMKRYHFSAEGKPLKEK